MIGIKMPMPKNCDDCPCEHDAACCVGKYRDPERYHRGYKSRPDDCPLIDLSRYKDDGK